MLGVDRPDRRRLARVRCRYVRHESLDRRIMAEMEQIHDAQLGIRGPSPSLLPGGANCHLPPCLRRVHLGVALNGPLAETM